MTKFRHAYMILAHNNFTQLQTLLNLLDDERNDIYLHIDKKSKNVPIFTTAHAGLILIERRNTSWGGYSLIECELALLEAASVGQYSYYHLLSGVDLPLKTQDQIHAFFQENGGKEYIDFDELSNANRSFLLRTQYYHFFQDLAGSSPKFYNRMLRMLNWGLVYLQKLIRFSRKEEIPLYKGAQWFSITDQMVQYILSCRDSIRKQFRYTYCADEIFLPSVAMASPLRKNINRNYLRAIDWHRGDPYVYRAEDVPALLASDKLWARKFSEKVDQDAIDLIWENLGCH